MDGDCNLNYEDIIEEIGNIIELTYTGSITITESLKSIMKRIKNN